MSEEAAHVDCAMETGNRLAMCPDWQKGTVKVECVSNEGQTVVVHVNQDDALFLATGLVEWAKALDRVRD